VPIDKEFQGSIVLSTGYEVKFDPGDMRHTLNHLSLAIVGELSNKHLFQSEAPSSEAFQAGLFEEIQHIVSTQVPDETTGSQLLSNFLFWHLMDRFFADMVASIHLPDDVRQRFLRRDWSLIAQGDSPTIPDPGNGETKS
jgi:hypothetical protein